MDTKALRQKILDLAIRGKLVPQDPNDEPASVLLERIRAEKQQMVKDGKLKAKDIKNDTIIFCGEDNLHYEKFADGAVKCIEDEIPFEVPEGWVWARIVSISQDLPYGTSKKSSSSGEIAVLRMGNLQQGEIDFADLVYSSDKEDIDKYLLTDGDLLFNRTNSSEWVGKTAIYRSEIAAIYAGYLIRIRSFLDAEYLNGVMNSKYIKEICSLVKTDAVNQSNINAAKLGRFLIPVPPFNEQLRISNKLFDVLNWVNYIVTEKLELGQCIQQIKSRILDLAICGKLVPQDPNDEPASVLLKRIRNEKEALIKQGKIKRDKKETVIFKGGDNSYYQSGKEEPLVMPFKIPDSWTWSNLQELCNYGNCINVSSEYIPKNAWILDLEDIEKDSGKIQQRISNKQRQSSSTKHKFHKNMILYSKLRPYLNKVVLADMDGYCTSEILPLDFIKIIYPQYAQFFLMSPFFVEYATHCSYGMKMPRLGTKDGQNAYFSVPPYEEQIRIVKAVKQFWDELQCIEESII